MGLALPSSPCEPEPWEDLNCGSKYMEDEGDLVGGFIMGVTEVTIWLIGVMNLLTKSS